jgi:hypothetical protein
MENLEILSLDASLVNSVSVYLLWYVSPSSPTDTTETDTFFISYTNQSNMVNTVVDVGNLMNYLLNLSPTTTYTISVYSINQFGSQSIDSTAVQITTGTLFNTYSANAGVRPYILPTIFNEVTIEDLNNVVTVSASILGNVNPEPTFVDVITSTSPKPFYQLYKIDPKGQLFGNTPCGYFNFKKRTITI